MLPYEPSYQTVCDLLILITILSGLALLLVMVWYYRLEDKRNSDRELMQELIDAAPWCDPAKVALEPEYQPIIFKRTRRKKHGKAATKKKATQARILSASNTGSRQPKRGSRLS